MTKSKSEYIKTWMKNNRARTKSHKLKWYYKNRDEISKMMSKPKAGEGDEQFMLY